MRFRVAPASFPGRIVAIALLLAASCPARAADSPAAVRPMSELSIAATIKIGTTADWVAITPAGVWVGSSGPNAVSEIDPATNRVTTIELPGRPCAGIAADAQAVWVPLCGPAPKLAKVDVGTRRLARVLEIGPAAPEGGIAIGAGSVWLVTDKAGTLARLDPASGRVVQSVRLPAGSYNPVFGGGRIWVSRVEGAELTIVDPQTATVSGRAVTGPHPRFLAAGAKAVWTLNQGDGTLTRVDMDRPQSTETIALHTPGAGGDVAFGAGRIWTTMMQTPLTAVDASNGRVLCQWQGGGGDSLNIGHGSIWLTNLRAGTVSRIPLDTLPAECRPAAATP